MAALAGTDLLIYASANMPTNDTGTSGGAIDETKRVTFGKLLVTGAVDIQSSNSGDTTQTVTVYGQDSTGADVNEVLALNGLTVVIGAQAFATVDRIVVSAAHVGTITVRRATALETIAAVSYTHLTMPTM